MSLNFQCGSLGCYVDVNDGYKFKMSCWNGEHYWVDNNERKIFTLI
jgi:hypothetical protein